MPDLAWAATAFDADRQDDYRLYRAYYEGRHRLGFATKKWQQRFGRLFDRFRDNVCPIPVDSLVDRLELLNFLEPKAPALGDAAWALWTANDLQARSPEVYTEAARCGDAYALIWPDRRTGVPRYWPHHADVCRVRYDAEEPGLITDGVKRWLEPDPNRPGKMRWRLTIFDREGWERWQAPLNRTGAAAPTDPDRWEPVNDDEGAAGTHPWEQVPLLHYPNGTELGAYGSSELKDVVPIQDALNKAVADLLVGMEAYALPQRAASGVVPQYDDEGNEIDAFQPGSTLWTVGAPDARFHQFDPADLKQLLEVHEAFRVEVARITGTPLHDIVPTPGGQAPSGVALAVSEGRQNRKARRRQMTFGAVDRRAAELMLRMADVPDAVVARLVPKWRDPATRDEKAAAEAALIKRQAGWPLKQILREAGYDDDDVDRMLEEEAATAGAAAERALQSFTAGGGGF